MSSLNFTLDEMEDMKDLPMARQICQNIAGRCVIHPSFMQVVGNCRVGEMKLESCYLLVKSLVALRSRIETPPLSDHSSTSALTL